LSSTHSSPDKETQAQRGPGLCLGHTARQRQSQAAFVRLPDQCSPHSPSAPAEVLGPQEAGENRSLGSTPEPHLVLWNLHVIYISPPEVQNTQTLLALPSPAASLPVGRTPGAVPWAAHLSPTPVSPVSRGCGTTRSEALFLPHHGCPQGGLELLSGGQ
jgi:hypothetical protein